MKYSVEDAKVYIQYKGVEKEIALRDVNNNLQSEIRARCRLGKNMYNKLEELFGASNFLC